MPAIQCIKRQPARGEVEMLMSYQMRELQSAALASFLPWLHATANFFAAQDNSSDVTPLNQLAAGCELLVRLCKPYPKPEFRSSSVYRLPTGELRNFVPGCRKR
jgi:hypothetical protein